MPSERELIAEIEKHAQALAQAVAAAEFWHGKTLEAIEQERQKRLAEIEAEYKRSTTTAAQAYDKSLSQVKAELAALEPHYGLAESGWDAPQWGAFTPLTETSIPRLTRVGWLTAQGKYGQIEMPALVPIIGSRNVLIKASGAGKEMARAAMQSIMLKLLATLPPGKLRFVCIDPVGLGATVAGFIKGLPPLLHGGQSWFDSTHIEQQLADLETRIAFVKQKYLGNSFASMEDYNAKAGQIEEPYRLLVVSDFPARFSDSAAQRLISIATNGPSTGVYVLAMADTEQKMPYNFNLGDLERTATILTCDSRAAAWQDPDFKDCALELDRVPSHALFERIVKGVGEAAEEYERNRVKVPFASLGQTAPNWENSDTRAGLQVPIGQFGAREMQYFVINEELLSSALIIGKTGAGKSTLLHTLVNGLALAYPPNDLELYLLDLQEVGFKPYATHQLPHARVVAINCEREFGLSVLRKLDAELHQRMETFRSAGVDALSKYRNATGQKLPRLLLMVDEFQELFIADDALAAEVGLILDRLVRQGRKFGINVLLASQTLAGPYSFSAATRNQIPIRIALQCSDADSRLVLSDENDEARLLERPGEAIYNAKNGLLGGNNRFQAALLEDDERETMIQQVRELAQNNQYRPVWSQIVFEGNAPARIENNVDLMNLLTAPDGTSPSGGWPAPQKAVAAWLGEPIEIKPHTAALFRRQSGSNLLIVGQNEHEPAATAMLTTALLSLAAQHRPEAAQFVVVNLADVDAPWHELPEVLARSLPHKAAVIMRRGAAQAIEAVAAELNRRTTSEDETRWLALYLAIFGLHRARDLRRSDEPPLTRYDADNNPIPRPPTPAEQLAAICHEGPDVGIHILLWCDTYADLERVFDRSPEKSFDLRVALQMNAEDSRRLLDSEAASKLGPHRALYLDEERTGRVEKFRPYGLAGKEWIEEWGGRLKGRR